MDQDEQMSLFAASDVQCVVVPGPETDVEETPRKAPIFQQPPAVAKFKGPKWYSHFFETLPSQIHHRCKTCPPGSEPLKAKHGMTSNLVRHLKGEGKKVSKACADAYKEYMDKELKQQPSIKKLLMGQKNANAEIKSKSGDATKEINWTDGDQKELDNLLAKFVIGCELPLHFVSREEFIAFCMKLNSLYVVPSTYKLFTHAISPMKAESDFEILAVMQNALSIDITFDAWSSRKMVSYMGLCAHFIDPHTGAARNEALGCSYFDGSHTGERMAQWTFSCLKKWDLLEGKVTRVGSDNAFAAVKAVRELLSNQYEIDEESSAILELEADEETERLVDGTVSHMQSSLMTGCKDELKKQLMASGHLEQQFGCAAHLLQLSVKDFMERKLGVRGKMSKLVSRITNFIHSTKKSLRCGEIYKDKKFNFVMPCITRWGSQYKMLLSIVKHQEHLELFPTDLKHAPPKRGELSVVQELLDALEPAHLFTEALQSRESTVGLVVPGLRLMDAQLSDEECSSPNSPAELFKSDVKKHMGHLLESKFYKVAAVLDPRVAYGMKSDAGALAITREAMQLAHDVAKEAGKKSPEKAEPEEPAVKKRRTLFSLVQATPKPKAQTFGDTVEEQIQLELNLYLNDTATLYGNLEISPSMYWKSNGAKFTTLAKIAAYSNGAPASTAEVERLFSVAGRIMRPHRACLTPQNGECLTILKHRADAKKFYENRARKASISS